MSRMESETDLQKALRLAGGPTALARKCKVSRQTVHFWINDGPTRLGALSIAAALRELEPSENTESP